MNVELIRHNFERYGLLAGAHDVAKKGANRLVPLRLLRVLRLVRDDVAPSWLELPAGFRWGPLDAARLLEHATDPALDLEPAFVRASVGEGDRSYGITQGDRLVSYGWYSSRPTPIAEALAFHFDEAYVYMYKGFTRPEVRGQRLHAIGMARALEVETERGCSGVLSYVESNNFASLRSCDRLGYERVGSILLVTVSGRTLTFATPGCRRYRIGVRRLTSRDRGPRLEAPAATR